MNMAYNAKFSQINLITGKNGIGKSALLLDISEEVNDSTLIYESHDYDSHIVYMKSIEKNNYILKIMNLVDNTVKEIVYYDDISIVYTKNNDNSRYKYLLNEGFGRVLSYFVAIFNNEDGVLLIDEIENGIHYSLYYDIWDLLFELAIKYNIQIFTTTHSLEMILAFVEVNKKYKVGAYFEMATHVRTKKISIINHRMETLQYELDRNIEVRG